MKCPVCSKNNFDIIGKIKDKKHNNNKILLCKYCSLGLLQKIPNENEHKEYYQNEYRNSTRGTSNIDNEIKKHENNRAKNILSFLKKHIPEGDKLDSILDIGCSTGSLLTLLGEWKSSSLLMGIELNADYVSYIKDKVKKIDIIGGNLEEFDATKYKSSVDMLSIVHVLEHLRSPNEAIDKIKLMLKDDALLYLEVPNLFTPYANLWHNYFSYYHLFYFNSLNLKLFLENAGFTIIAKNRPGKISIGYLCKYNSIKKGHKASLSFLYRSGFQKCMLFVYQIKYYLIIILKFILKTLHVKRFRA